MNSNAKNYSRFDERMYDIRALPKNVRTTVEFVRMGVIVLLSLFFMSILINTISLAITIGDANANAVEIPGYWFIIAVGVALVIWVMTLLRDRLTFKTNPKVSSTHTLTKLIADDTGFYYYSRATGRMAASWAHGGERARRLRLLPRIFYYFYLTLILSYPIYFWFVINQLSGDTLPNLPDVLYLISSSALIVLYVLFFVGMLIPRPPPTCAK